MNQQCYLKDIYMFNISSVVQFLSLGPMLFDEIYKIKIRWLWHEFFIISRLCPNPFDIGGMRYRSLSEHF